MERGQISLLWEKSGATITGRSGVGDFVVKGESMWTTLHEILILPRQFALGEENDDILIDK